MKTNASDNISDYPPIQGRMWRLGNNIDTDLIVPSHVLTAADQNTLLQATLESIFPNFTSEVRLGDIIVAGTNFGCGSSREEAVFVLKELGIRAIIAESFARIFFRNAINLGLPAIKMENSSILGQHLEIIRVNLSKGTVKNLKSEKKFQFAPFPSFLLQFIIKGGAIPQIKEKLDHSLK
ncbi:MAG: LeuD/DmdB family oxidoreductase small subunit [Promethearchaeota archaeon]